MTMKNAQPIPNVKIPRRTRESTEIPSAGSIPRSSDSTEAPTAIRANNIRISRFFGSGLMNSLGSIEIGTKTSSG